MRKRRRFVIKAPGLPAQSRPGRETMMQAAAARLAEYFDSVNIVVTWKDNKGFTHTNVAGSGNWYARYGSTQEWLKSSDYNSFMDIYHGYDEG
jgi:hypothetical protein